MSYTYVDRVSVTVDFRLMDRIKPRLTRVAIALGFPPHSIEVLEKKSDPECYLLSEWLSGRSTKASGPLTWGTLITALRHAGLMEEVRILEEHFIVTPVETVSQASKQLNCKQVTTVIKHNNLFVLYNQEHCQKCNNFSDICCLCTKTNHKSTKLIVYYDSWRSY